MKFLRQITLYGMLPSRCRRALKRDVDRTETCATWNEEGLDDDRSTKTARNERISDGIKQTSCEKGRKGGSELAGARKSNEGEKGRRI